MVVQVGSSAGTRGCRSQRGCRKDRRRVRPVLAHTQRLSANDIIPEPAGRKLPGVSWHLCGAIVAVWFEHPVGHRAELRHHRPVVGAHAVCRVRPAHGFHEVGNDTVEQRRVPRRPLAILGAVGGAQLRHRNLRVRIPRSEAHVRVAEVAQRGVVAIEGAALAGTRQVRHDVDLHRRGGLHGLHRLRPVDGDRQRRRRPASRSEVGGLTGGCLR